MPTYVVLVEMTPSLEATSASVLMSAQHQHNGGGGEFNEREP